jgi:proliferating cell nuclear antigen
MDSSHCSMFEIKITKEWFDLFQVDEELTLGINTDILYKIFHTKQNNQYIELQCEDADRLSINFINLENSSDFPKEYEISLMDIDSEILHIPDCDFNVEFSLESKPFSTVIDQLAIFGDNIEFCCSEENMDLIAKGDLGTMKVNLLEEDKKYVEEIIIGLDDEKKFNYSIKFLQMFCSFSKIIPNVKINLLENVPMRMQYSLTENSYIHLFLAPKIED